MTGGQALVAALAAHGVDTVFGIPGTHNLAIYDALYQHPNIRHISARHEQGAAYMADGYARTSGKVGVCVTVTGPGGTNALSALGQAYSDSSPVLLVQSQVELTAVDREQENFHELRDSLSVFRAVTGWNARPRSVEAIPEVIGEAFRRLRGGRPRPVQIEVPRDVLGARGEVNIPAPSPVEPRLADPDEVRRAAALLAAARRPLILAGGGAVTARATAALAELANLLQAPVATTIMGKGVLPEDHPLCLGDGWGKRIIGRAVFGEADLVLAVGVRFSQLATDGRTLALGGPLVHVDVDPGELGKHYPVAVGLAGDAGAVLGQLLAALREQGAPSPATPWCQPQQVRAERRQSAEAVAGETLRVLDGLRGVLPRDAVFVNDLTAVSYWAGFGLPVYEPRTFLYPSGYGCLGFALPAAIGAKLARPEREVVALAGDGGCLFTCAELATAAQHGVKLTVVVFNDAGYGALRADQGRNYGGRLIGADLNRVDFAALARALGVRGVSVAALAELPEAVATALGQPGPTLLEAPAPAAVPPWLE